MSVHWIGPQTHSQHLDTIPPAGVLEDKSLLKQTPGSFRTVLAGKVSGLLRLGSALTAIPLRALALFSSVSSLVAPVGQPNYATANAMLNHWASQHAAQGDSCSLAVQTTVSSTKPWQWCSSYCAHASPVCFLFSSFI